MSKTENIEKNSEDNDSSTAGRLSRALFSFLDFLNHQTASLGIAITLLAIRQFGNNFNFTIVTDVLGLLLASYSLYVSIKATNDFRSFLNSVQPENERMISMKQDIAGWIVVGYANIFIVMLCVIGFLGFNIYEYLL